MIFLFENGPAVSVIDYLLALFDTTSRAMGGKLNCAGAHSGIAGLWLGRGTIIGERGHREAAYQGCFGLDGYRWAPYLAVFYSDRKFTAIPCRYRWSWRIRRIAFPFFGFVH